MADKTIASRLGDHCFVSVKHTGVPAGSIVVLAAVETYVSKPSTTPADGLYDKIVIFFSDVYSPLYLNNQLVQDYFASQGYLVLGVDYFEGDPMNTHYGEANWDRQAWADAKIKRSNEIVPEWLEAVKVKYGKASTKYAAVGYCFGAPHVMNLAATGILCAAAIAHPGLLEEDHFRNLKAPLLLSCAETDTLFPLDKRRLAEDILVETQKSYHIQVFSGVVHGFAVRGDPEIEEQRWAKEESARGIAEWFQRFFK